LKKQTKEFNAYVFFTDIVSASDRKYGSSEDQIKKIELLFNFIKKSSYFKESGKNPIISQTGDGAALCYRYNIRLPIELAIDLHKKINIHNKKKPFKQQLKIRIGISSGLIGPTKGIKKGNYWGLGLISAQRIMSLGKSNHILMNAYTATELSFLSDRYKNIIHYVGESMIKNNEDVIPIYSVYGDGFGNKLMLKLKTKDEMKDMGRLTIKSLNAKEIKNIADTLQHYSKTQLHVQQKQKSIHKTNSKNKKGEVDD